jgi:hypothetical protein
VIYGAVIQDAAITTLKIAGNAVTVPFGVSGWTDVNGSVTLRNITVDGLNASQPTLIIFSAGVTRHGNGQCYMYAEVNGSAYEDLACYFYASDRSYGEKKTGSLVISLGTTSARLAIKYWGTSGADNYSSVTWTVAVIHCKR